MEDALQTVRSAAGDAGVSSRREVVLCKVDMQTEKVQSTICGREAEHRETRLLSEN
jgi:hypothetical protein